ncbi:MAG: hypothetical protein KatS3mg008_1061 [Acidimicrobiales bacterium]|nr:MAG: hypothetical protein KatS3mg008_1061 [Acidimicrobiales bacterium]
MDLGKLSQGDKVIGICGILLFIGLLFFPWHSIEVGFGNFTSSTTCNAMDCTGEFWGILAFLLTIAVVVVVVLDRLTEVQLPEIPIPWERAAFFGAIGVEALLFLKLILETDFLGWGAWVNILLAGGMIVGGFLNLQQTTSGTASGDA